MKRSWFLPLILVCLSVFSSAQQWSGVLSSSRAIDWSQAGVVGGIPNRTTICATLGAANQSPTYSQNVSSAQINTAIASCPAGQVVFLNAGTYHISGITFHTVRNVSLRGAGADQTFLVFSSPDGCEGSAADVCMSSVDTNYWGGPSNSANWTAGYSATTNVITLSSASNLHVGQPIVLDQVDDVSDGGAIYTGCEYPSGKGGGSGCYSGTWPSGAQRGSGSSIRGQQQMVNVVSCTPACPNGGTTQVTITPGLYAPNWRGSQSPGAWWSSAPITADGIENLSMDHSGSTSTSGIAILNCYGCWVLGIRDLNTDRNHVWNEVSNHTTVRDSYFYGTRNASSESYGIESFVGSDLLWENNIFQNLAAPQVLNSDCEGCVDGYNYSVNDDYASSTNWLAQSATLHSVEMFSLLEGNVGAAMYSDNFHGTHNFNTIFRTRFDGYEENNGNPTSSNTNPIRMHPYTRYQNLIGNVLGVAGYHTKYQCTSSSCPSPDLSIYIIGTAAGTGTTVADDPATVSTLMRWGNYDVVQGAPQWNASEVPSGIGAYANPVPSSQSLPPSFYHSGAPAWWPSSKPWPAIGPDVTGGNIAGLQGHANTIPAQDCYAGTMGGPSNGMGSPLTFNASSCYSGGSSGGPPAPPTNLKAVAQ